MNRPSINCVIASASCALGVFLTGACVDLLSPTDPRASPEDRVDRVWLRPAGVAVLVGETARFSAFASRGETCGLMSCDPDQVDVPISWTSSNPAVATLLKRDRPQEYRYEE